MLSLRLQRQHLATRVDADRLVDVVGDMVGIHAQVMSSAELQLAARVDGLRPTDVRAALWERRTIVKSWAFRNTLHLLTPVDHALFVASAAVQEAWKTGAWQRYFGLAPDEIEAMVATIGDLLTDRPMTKVELGDAVAARLDKPHLAEKLRSGWGTYLSPATRRGKLVFGPSEGRNVAFVNPAAWLGDAWTPRAQEPIEALAELVARYLAVFPGASRSMIQRWWGGLRSSPFTAALKLLGDRVAQLDVDGVALYALRDDAAVLASQEPFHGVRLLPGFDPFTNELPRHVDSVLPDDRHDQVHRQAGWVSPVVVLDGRVRGTWEIAGSARAGRVEVVPFGRWRAGVRGELEAEADRYAAFLGRPLAVSLDEAAAG